MQLYDFDPESVFAQDYDSPAHDAIVTAHALDQLRGNLRSELLALNRNAAGRLGLDPRYTISSNAAAYIVRLTGVPFTTAKQMFHAGIAGATATMINASGVPLVEALGVAVLLYAWLESFDSATLRQ